MRNVLAIARKELTLYFTTAVWMSIALSRVPSLKPKGA